MRNNKKEVSGIQTKNHNSLNGPAVCIIGPGIVGQATGKAFIKKGVKTAFIGRTETKTYKLKKEGYEAYTWDDLTNGYFNFDISMLTVPTLTINGKIDLSHIKSAAVELGKRIRNLKKYHVVVVKSTVLPGTTRSLVGRIIEECSNKKLGRDFGLCMNPEYLREETALDDAINPWLILIGEYDEKSGDTLSKVYKNFDSSIFRSSLEEAEIQKYIHNLFNAVKIVFFNEIREIGRQKNMDIDRVFKLVALSSEGMWNPKYGIKDKGPFMGSCLPKDTQAFYAWAKSSGFNADVLKAAIDSNRLLIEKRGLQKIAYKTHSVL